MTESNRAYRRFGLRIKVIAGLKHIVHNSKVLFEAITLHRTRLILNNTKNFNFQWRWLQLSSVGGKVCRKWVFSKSPVHSGKISQIEIKQIFWGATGYYWALLKNWAMLVRYKDFYGFLGSDLFGKEDPRSSNGAGGVSWPVQEEVICKSPPPGLHYRLAGPSRNLLSASLLQAPVVALSPRSTWNHLPSTICLRLI